MTFVRANGAGWALLEILTSAQMNVIDSQIPFALDGQAGGTYAPAAPIILDGSVSAATSLLEIQGRSHAGGKALYVESPSTAADDGCGHFVPNALNTYGVLAARPAVSSASTPVSGIEGRGAANSSTGDGGDGVSGAGGNSSYATGLAGRGVVGIGGAATGTGINFGGAGGQYTGGAADVATSGAIGGSGVLAAGGAADTGGNGVTAIGGATASATLSKRSYGVHATGGTRNGAAATSSGYGLYAIGGATVTASNQDGGYGGELYGANGDGTGNGGTGVYGNGGDGGATSGNGGYGGFFKNGVKGGTGNPTSSLYLSTDGSGARHIQFDTSPTLDTPSGSHYDRVLQCTAGGELYFAAQMTGSVTRKWLGMLPVAEFQGYIKLGTSAGAQTLAKTANAEYNIDTFTTNGINYSIILTFEDTMPSPVGSDYLVFINQIYAAANGAPSGLAPAHVTQVRSKTTTTMLFRLINVTTGAEKDPETGGEYVGLDIKIYAPPQ